MSDPPSVKMVWPEFKAFWMWQDRYMVSIMRDGDIDRPTISIYEEGELLTDGNLYGNDF